MPVLACVRYDCVSVSSQFATSGCAESISLNCDSMNLPKPKPLAIANIMAAIGTIAIMVENDS